MIAVLSFFGSPLGKVAGVIAIVAVLIIGGNLWLISHDHAIRAAVTEELTAQFEAQAAAAQAKEAQRQAAAAKAATDALNTQLASAKAAEAKATADLDKGISEYEAKLQAANRRCNLTDDDVTAIVHNGSSNSLGHH